MHARYTKGPDELGFGPLGEIAFKRGEWRELDAKHREQLELPDRVEEYGFECSDVKPQPDAAASTPAAPAVGLGGD